MALLLLEDGSALLLEDGTSNLLLEGDDVIAPTWSIVDGGSTARVLEGNVLAGVDD